MRTVSLDGKPANLPADPVRVQLPSVPTPKCQDRQQDSLFPHKLYYVHDYFILKILLLKTKDVTVIPK